MTGVLPVTLEESRKIVQALLHSGKEYVCVMKLHGDATEKRVNEVLREFEPNSSVAPILLTGGTDSRFFRKIGSICYGFQPMRADMPYGEILKSIHGIDERISIENLVFGTSVLYNVVERFMT